MPINSDYQAAYERSLTDPEGFWGQAAEEISWFRRWDRVLDASRAPFVRWFPGAELNTCYNAVDRHVERGRGKQRALIYDSPVTGTIQTFTYLELLDRVAAVAGALRASGVAKGDRVLIYMPGVPEAVFAMLACARLGAIHSVVFGGFASKELATRIAAEGHEVGLHCYRHRSLLRTGPRHTRDDLLRAAATIEAATGRRVRLYRPPYGVLNTPALGIARREGWQVWLWRREARDWQARATAASIAGPSRRRCAATSMNGMGGSLVCKFIEGP